MTHKTATGVYSKEQRAHRDSAKAANQAAAQTTMDVQNAPAKSDPNQYTSSHQANDAGRESTGKRNRPESRALTGTSSAKVNAAMDKANVGQDD